MKRILHWLGNWRRWLWRTLVILLLGAILFYGICYMLTFQAATIFNRVAAERQLFPGTVTVERLSADFLGGVSFENLCWVSEEGVLLADIPEGRFAVKPWDIVTGHIGTMTVKSLEINRGYVHLFFDDHMHLRYIKPRRGETGPDAPIRITGASGNRRFDCEVVVNDSVIEAESPDRHFKMEHVNLKLRANTVKRLDLDLSAGPFSGTVGAGAIRMGGNVDLSSSEPVYDLFLAVKDLRPKTLGVGVDIDDPVSAEARIAGKLPRPLIDGTLAMKELHLPGLVFSDVAGRFHYEDGKLDAPRVTAHAFGGDVKASGQFDLDGKSYEAVIHGEGLHGGMAAHDIGLRCEVTLDLSMKKAGPYAEQELSGRFVSGEGRYHVLPFKKISGTFDRRDGILSFHDVVISLSMGDITTDALQIAHGKVRLGPLYLRDAVSGEKEQLR